VFGNWASRFWDGWAANIPARIRFDCAGPVYFDLDIICSTIFDSCLRNWEWHKGKKHRHPHLNLILLLAKPVDAERPAHTQGKIARLINSVPTVCGPGEQKAAVSDSSESFLRAAGYGQPQATSMLFKSLAPDNLTRYTIGTP